METRDGVFNAVAMSGYSRRLGRLLDAGRFPLVLGGDCSIVLGAALALNRPGRYGLAFLDGHSDFRHLGNSPRVGAAAGEDLALVTGRGQADLTDLDGPAAVCAGRGRGRAWHPRQRWALAELHGLGVPVWEVARLRADGPATATSAALRHLERDGVDGLWLHLDPDILDPAVLPAVDSPDPGGLGHDELAALLTRLVASPSCVGLEVTVFDLDPDGALALALTDTLAAALAPALTPPRKE